MCQFPLLGILLEERLDLLLKLRGVVPVLAFLDFVEIDPSGDFELELTWLRDHPQAYDLGEEEFHLAFKVDDYEAAHALHDEMGCICFENPDMGIYFIQDPDGYWLEILPESHE